MEHKPKRPNELGASGRRVAANIEKLREDRHLNQEQLAERVQNLGRPMTRQAISKVEGLDRRVDVDDLVALATALDVSPNRLLLPDSAGQDEVELLPNVIVRSLDAWHWAAGEEPLPSDVAQSGRQVPDPGDQDFVTSRRLNAFVRENRPQDKQTEPYGLMFTHGDLTDAVVTAARLAREHGISLAEVKFFLDFIYTVTLAQAEQTAQGKEEG
jgi:transcriptional regulator with XRE-family HTH domain